MNQNREYIMFFFFETIIELIKIENNQKKLIIIKFSHSSEPLHHSKISETIIKSKNISIVTYSDKDLSI